LFNLRALITQLMRLLGPDREIQPPRPSFWLVVAHLRRFGTLFWGRIASPLPLLLPILPSILVLIAPLFFTPVLEVYGRGGSGSSMLLHTEEKYWIHKRVVSEADGLFGRIRSQGCGEDPMKISSVM
jgi:hypothetical protein